MRKTPHFTDRNPGWSRRLLHWDCVFLIVAGVAGLGMDLTSHIAGQGPFGDTFLRNPLVIGVIEAHGLAVLAAVGVLIAPASARLSRHLQLAVIHLLLGGSNIAFFEVFRLTGGETPGIAITAVHFALVMANLAALIPAGRGEAVKSLAPADGGTRA